MKKDILMLCQFFYPEHVSSATLPFDTAKYLCEHGFTVDVITGYPKEYSNSTKIKKKENIFGVNIKRIKYIQLKRSKRVCRLINYLSFTIFMFFQIFKMRKYKNIIIYSNPPLLVYVGYICHKLFKSQITFICYDIYPEIAVQSNQIKENSFTSKSMKHINTRVYPILSNLVVLSSDMKNFVLKNRSIEINKIHVIPNWFEDLYNENCELYPSLDHSSLYNKFVVSYLGNIGLVQDIESVLDGIIKLKEYKDIVFVFAGHGNQFDKVKETRINYNLNNVITYDFLQGDDYKYILKMTDVGLISLKQGIINLASPSKIYQYMMEGKPVIGIIDTDTEYSKELDQFGFSINPGNITEFTNAILALKSNVSLLNQKSVASRKCFIEKYQKEVVLKKYFKLFKSEDN